MAQYPDAGKQPAQQKVKQSAHTANGPSLRLQGKQKQLMLSKLKNQLSPPVSSALATESSASLQKNGDAVR